MDLWLLTAKHVLQFDKQAAEGIKKKAKYLYYRSWYFLLQTEQNREKKLQLIYPPFLQRNSGLVGNTTYPILLAQ